MRQARSIPSSLLSEGRLARVVEVAAARGIRIGSKTAIRWTTAGKRGVRLPSIRIGTGRCTTPAAFDAWLQAIAALEAGDAAPPGSQLGAGDVERILEAHGLGRGAI